MPGSAFSPATEAVSTIAPPWPADLIARIAALSVRKAPSRLGDITLRHSARLVSAMGEVAQAVLVQVGEDQLARALGGEAGGDRCADPGGGAGDERDGVCEAGHGP